MSVIRICLNSDWNYQETISKELHDKFLKIFKDLNEYEKCKYNQESEVIIDYDMLENIDDEILHHKYISLKPLKKLRFSEYDCAVPDLNKAPSKQDIANVIKQTFQIHLPNNELLSFASVDYLEDYCTDQLGDCLGKGWRILAVCPQAGNRRPDYVLGHKDAGIKI